MRSVLEELGCNESEIDPKAMNFVKIGRGCRTWEKTINLRTLGSSIIRFDEWSKQIYFVKSKYLDLVLIFGTMLRISGKNWIEVSVFPGQEIYVTLNQIKYSNYLQQVLGPHKSYGLRMEENLYPVTHSHHYDTHDQMGQRFNEIFKKLKMHGPVNCGMGNVLNLRGPRDLSDLKLVTDLAGIDFELNLADTMRQIHGMVQSS